MKFRRLKKKNVQKVLASCIVARVRGEVRCFGFFFFLFFFLFFRSRSDVFLLAGFGS